MSIKIGKKKLSSMGPDTILIIPRKFIQYNILSIEKLYNIIFEEVEIEESTKDKKSIQEDN